MECYLYVIQARTTKTVSVTVQGKELKYDVLNVLEFNSTRKRMSVIVRTPEGKVSIHSPLLFFLFSSFLHPRINPLILHLMI